MSSISELVGDWIEHVEVANGSIRAEHDDTGTVDFGRVEEDDGSDDGYEQ
jgi:hypothetical protein